MAPGPVSFELSKGMFEVNVKQRLWDPRPSNRCSANRDHES